MTEFEIHQLIIAMRWEFDAPTLLMFIISMGFVVIALWQTNSLNVLTVPILQLSYALIASFLFLRVRCDSPREQTH